ncbi:poxvirus late transcription factor [Faustovirus]|nr:poxvirus late transcription factor [Faustovirus]
MSSYCNCGGIIQHTKYNEETDEKKIGKEVSTHKMIRKIIKYIRKRKVSEHIYISIIDRDGQPMTKRIIKALSMRTDLGRNWNDNIHYESFCCCYYEKSEPILGTKYIITSSDVIYKRHVHKNHIIIHDSMRTPRKTMLELAPLFANDNWKNLMIIAVFTKSHCTKLLKADIKQEVIDIAKNKGWLYKVGDERRYRSSMYYIAIRLTRI